MMKPTTPKTVFSKTHNTNLRFETLENTFRFSEGESHGIKKADTDIDDGRDGQFSYLITLLVS